MGCWFYSQPMRLLIHSVNSSSAFDRIIIRMYACKKETQTDSWKLSVENALKYEFAINHERCNGVKENNIGQSIITSTSL